MSGVNSMHSYREYFGLPIGKGTPATGIVYGIYTIGNLLGSFVAGPATDYRGLRNLNV
jgi:MFS family permease